MPLSYCVLLCFLHIVYTVILAYHMHLFIPCGCLIMKLKQLEVFYSGRLNFRGSTHMHKDRFCYFKCLQVSRLLKGIGGVDQEEMSELNRCGA